MGREQNPGRHHFESSQTVMLAIAGVEDEDMVGQQLHAEAHHVVVRYHLQELEMESTKPDSVAESG